MEYVFFAAFATLAAILFNYGYPRVTAMTWAQSTTFSSYAGKTFLTAISFFVVLLAAGFLISIVSGNSKGATPPTA
jgi:hypothetical protein